MANSRQAFANREVLHVTFLDYATQVPVLYWPLANATATSVTGEVVYAYGGQGHVKRVPFYGEKGGTLTLETQMQAFQLYSIMTGGDLVNKADFIAREIVTADEDGMLTISGTPVDGKVNVFAAGDDCGTPIVAKFDGGMITGTNITADSNYVVYYMKNYTDGVTGIQIKAKSFPKAVTIMGETVSRTEDDKLIAQKVIAYKAAAQMDAEWSFSSSGDPASITITFDLMADSEDRVLDMLAIEE